MPFIKANPEKELEKIRTENPDMVDVFNKIDSDFSKKEASIKEQK